MLYKIGWVWKLPTNTSLLFSILFALKKKERKSLSRVPEMHAENKKNQPRKEQEKNHMLVLNNNKVQA